MPEGEAEDCEWGGLVVGLGHIGVRGVCGAAQAVPSEASRSKWWSLCGVHGTLVKFFRFFELNSEAVAG